MLVVRDTGKNSIAAFRFSGGRAQSTAEGVQGEPSKPACNSAEISAVCSLPAARFAQKLMLKSNGQNTTFQTQYYFESITANNSTIRMTQPMFRVCRVWAQACNPCNGLVRATREPVGASSLTYQQARGIRVFRERTVRAMYWRGRSFDKIEYPQRKPSEMQTWNYRSEVFAFSRRLQENLGEDTLRRVFAHQSYVDKLTRDQAKYDLPAINLDSNSELIHRGHQLLDQCIKPYLRYTFPHMPEEGITSISEYLKSEIVLSDIAKWIGCKDVILSAERNPSPFTMANTVLALLAGIEADLGLPRVQRFVNDIIISYLNDKDILDDVWIIPNPKETLALILESNQLPPYEPRIMFQTGIKTIESCYVVGLYVNQKLLGQSPGETLAIAEECAALNSLQRLFDLTENRAPFVYGEESEKIDYKAHLKEHDRIGAWRFKLE